MDIGGQMQGFPQYMRMIAKPFITLGLFNSQSHHPP